MTIGAELRVIMNNAIKDTKQKIKDWFDEHMNELKGAALGGTDCIVYNNEETFEFFKDLFDKNEIILEDFCSEESIEIEIELKGTEKEIVISWNKSN